MKKNKIETFKIKNNKKSNFIKSLTKPARGLTLIEALIALLIISISIPIITGLQIRLLRNTSNSFNMLERITAVRNMFVQASQNKWFEKKEPVKKNIDPNLALEYKAESFNKFRLKNLVKERINANWSNLLGANQDETYVSFSFWAKPEETKSGK